MRALVLEAQDQPLVVREVPTPEPGPGQARVRLKAAALNHRDVFILRGQYAAIRHPAILGSDGVGVVESTGPGTVVPVGLRVVVQPSLDWGDDLRFQGSRYRILGMPDDGTFAEAIVLPEGNLVAAPAHLDDASAGALPLAWLTAWRALVTRATLRPGERVLVTGIGGGVAQAALLLATAYGARVWVTSGDDAKIARAVELGACGGARYDQPDWGGRLVREAGGPFDVIVDGAGGEGFGQLVRALGMGGRLAFYGGTDGRWPALLPQFLFFKQVSLLATTMGSPVEFAHMVAFVAEHQLRPVVDRVFPLAEGAAAFARLESGAQFGKVVLDLT